MTFGVSYVIKEYSRHPNVTAWQWLVLVYFNFLMFKSNNHILDANKLMWNNEVFHRMSMKLAKIQV